MLNSLPLSTFNFAANFHYAHTTTSSAAGAAYRGPPNLLLPRGSTVSPDRYWGHWNFRDGAAQESGPPPVIRQALQALHQRSSAVRQLTLEREGSFEQRDAALRLNPDLAPLVGRSAPRPPPLDGGLNLAGAHQLAASGGEAVEEPYDAHEPYAEGPDDEEPHQEISS